MAGSAEGAGPRSWRSRNLAVRVASGLVLALVALVATWRGGLPFAGLLIAVLMVGLVEFYRLARRAGYSVQPLPGLCAALAILVLAVTHRAEGAGLVMLAAGLWMTAGSLRPPLEGRLVGLALTVLGVVYLAGLGLHLLWLREMPGGAGAVMLVFLATWAADTFAYFVGVRWGKRPLAPAVSPKKSVEGFVGGWIGTVVLTVGAGRYLAPEVGVAGLLLLGGVLGLAAPLGDLLESMMKRNLDAKDAAQTIPGHGGVLDRIDGLLVTAPVAYYLFRYILS